MVHPPAGLRALDRAVLARAVGDCASLQDAQRRLLVRLRQQNAISADAYTALLARFDLVVAAVAELRAGYAAGPDR